MGMEKIKKIVTFLKRADVWLTLASIVCLLFLPVVLCNFLGRLRTVEKLLVLASIFLDGVLIIRYKLYKILCFDLILVFLFWSVISGLFMHVDFTHAVGGSIQRNWYISLLFVIVAFCLEERKQRTFVSLILGTYSVIFSGFMFFSIFFATRSLVNSQIETSLKYGAFQSGRFTAFGNANSIGLFAEMVILCSIWFLAFRGNMNNRKLYKIVFGICTFVGIITLGLSRSRGAIVSTAIGIAIFVFIRIFKSKRKFFITMAISLVALVLSIVILLVPKKIYDYSLIKYEKTVSEVEAQRVEENLEAYGITYALDTLTDRTLIWSSTIKMMNERPKRWIFGVTAPLLDKNPILDIFPGRPEIGYTTTHNSYLQQLYTFGIPGVSIVLILLGCLVVQSFQSVFSKDKIKGEEYGVAILCAIMANGMVEASFLPFGQLFPTTIFGFFAIGFIMKNNKKEVTQKRKIQYGSLLLIGMLFITLLTGCVYKKSKDTADYIEPIENKEQNDSDYVRLNNDVTMEMMKPEFWIEKREKASENPDKVLLSIGEIEKLNKENRRTIIVNNASFSIAEIGDEFYYKIAKKLIGETAFDEKVLDDALVNGKEPTENYFETLSEGQNLETLNSRIQVKFGFSVKRTTLKKYPSEDVVIKKDSSQFYDEMVQSDQLPFMPVAILHESLDGEWYYVLTDGYGGWARKDSIALCDNRQEWLERQDPENFLVVTGREIRLPIDPYCESLSDLSIPMGTQIPIVAIEEAPEEIHSRIGYGNYIAKLPTRDEDGKIKDEYILIPIQEDVSLGYLPYTERNIAIQMFKFLGAEYGWAGDNNSVDCSSYTREVYKCFGIDLPRGSKSQADIECLNSELVKDKSNSKKKEILKDAPIGTMLYFPGHIMLYLGMVDNIPYCISSVGDFSTKAYGQGNIVEINTVVVTNMFDTLRKNGESWFANIERITIFEFNF